MDWIADLCNRLVARYQPQKVILFSRKLGLTGEVSSFKLCMVAQVADKRQAEREIYLEFECGVPYDVLIYLPGEWEQLRGTPGAFAQKIDQTGRVLYG